MSTKVQLNRHHKPQHPRNELEEAQCIQMLQDSGNILCACRAILLEKRQRYGKIAGLEIWKSLSTKIDTNQVVLFNLEFLFGDSYKVR